MKEIILIHTMIIMILIAITKIKNNSHNNNKYDKFNNNNGIRRGVCDMVSCIALWLCYPSCSQLQAYF
jgi:hypothetical protein